MAETTQLSHTAPTGHEPEGVSVKRILAIAAGLIAVIMLSATAIWGMLRLRGQPATSLSKTAPPVQPVNTPPPRLQISPTLDLEDLLARQRQRLNRYGWADRQQGIVHIPIERAMELLVQRGYPPPTPAEQPAQEPGVQPIVPGQGAVPTTPPAQTGEQSSPTQVEQPAPPPAATQTTPPAPPQSTRSAPHPHHLPSPQRSQHS
ncbi:MAG TPA: hypothetical protein VES89_11680 [Candidatus Competibacteraceae bacterium]|nr:hypothetical protein [Candidatus Competibacteraceae bacterium]